MMTTTTEKTMTMVVVMMITITKIARDYVEVPLLWSLPRASSVPSQGQERTESSSSSVVVGYYYLLLLHLSEDLEVPNYPRKAAQTTSTYGYFLLFLRGFYFHPDQIAIV